MGIKLPKTGDDPIVSGTLPDLDERYIMNPYCGKEMLTFQEALDLLNMISGELMADAGTRRRK